MRCGFCGTTKGETDGEQRDERDCCRTGLPEQLFVLGRYDQLIDGEKAWREHCPPRGGSKQWKRGYSAAESAAAWFRCGAPHVPRELLALFASVSATRSLRLATALPETKTQLDLFPGEGRNHDVLALGVAEGQRTVVAVEAKADEPFDRVVRDRFQSAIRKSNVPKRLNNLAEALFGRPAYVIDAAMAPLRYQLFHAVVGTLLEAKRRRANQAVFVVHHFMKPTDAPCEAFDDFRRFVAALGDRAAVDLQPGSLVRLQVHGSDQVPADIPLFVGWADALVRQEGE